MSFEYATVAVKPVVPRVFATDPILKSVFVFKRKATFAGFGSISKKFVAAEPPVFEKSIM